MDEGEKETVDIYCPKCNVQVEARVVAKHVQTTPIPGSDDSACDVTRFSLAECRRCEEVFLTKIGYCEIFDEGISSLTDLITLYPKPRSFDESPLPPAAARPYKNALGSYQAGLYEPCVIMCRKCLESICHENGIANGSLKVRLDTLRTKGVIDDKLLSWATGLRLVANDAAHEMDLVVDKDDAKDSLEFIETLFLYVFSLDQRFQEFQKRRQAAKRSGAGNGTD